MAKIKQLFVKHIKNIEHVEMIANDTINFIAGNNWAWKTTLVESIFQAISLKNFAKSDDAWKLIKKWEDKWEIRLVLDYNGQEVHITRTLDKEKWPTVVIKTADGASFPQKLVNTWIGDFTIDPLAFSKMRPQEQIDVLKRIAGINTDELDQKIEETYDKRRDVSRKERELRAIVDKYWDVEEVVEKKSAQELTDKKKEIIEYNASIEKAKDLTERATKAIVEYDNEIEQLLARIEKLKENKELAKKTIENNKELAKKELKDTSSIDQEIAEVEEHNEKAYKRQRHVERIKEHADAKEEAELADKKLQELREEKREVFEKAWLPIKDLTFDDEWHILIGWIPFDQHSTAEKIKISTDLATFDKPELRTLYIQDGSLLDDESMKIIADMSKERDYQVFVEIVGEDDRRNNTIILRNGRVLDSENK